MRQMAKTIKLKSCEIAHRLVEKSPSSSFLFRYILNLQHCE